MAVPKPTEMTIWDLLQEELRKRGVTVVPEFSVFAPADLLKLDLLLRNEAGQLKDINGNGMEIMKSI